MTISWDDVDRATDPVVVDMGSFDVHVNFKNIEVWLKHPDALFNLVKAASLADPRRYLLGAYELPGD